MRTIALLSGGLDSAVMLSRLSGHVHGLFVDYGQPARQRELESAYHVAQWAGIDLATFSLPLECNQLKGDDACVVPGRNLALIAAAANGSVRIGADAIAIGVTKADTAYPDCSVGFYDALRPVMECYGLGVLTPIITWDRATVHAEAVRIGLDVGLVWSCYRQGPDPCGACASCKQ
jgi:7-cyano-7-deazaguanine synthase